MNLRYNNFFLLTDMIAWQKKTKNNDFFGKYTV